MMKKSKKTAPGKKSKKTKQIRLPNFVPTTEQLTEKAMKMMYVALSFETDPSKIGKALAEIRKHEEYMERKKNPALKDAGSALKKLDKQTLKVLAANGVVMEDIEEVINNEEAKILTN